MDYLFMDHGIIISSRSFHIIWIFIWYKSLNSKIKYLNSSYKVHLLDKRLIQGESPCFGFESDIIIIFVPRIVVEDFKYFTQICWILMWKYVQIVCGNDRQHFRIIGLRRAEKVLVDSTYSFFTRTHFWGVLKTNRIIKLLVSSAV